MLEHELADLSRKHQGVVHECRIEHLGRLLDESGPVRVLRMSSGLSGDRLILALDDGAVMRLKMRHPDRRQLQMLHSIRWHEPFGWIVRGETPDGQHVEYRSWWASLSHATAERTTRS